MDGLDTLQKLTALVYFMSITASFVYSIIKRKKVAFGNFITTVIPGTIVYYLLGELKFLSTGKPGLEFMGFTLFISGGILGWVAFSHLGFVNSDDFWLGRREKKPRYLVTTGPYKAIRHPIFMGLVLQYLGLVLVFLHPASIIIWLFGLIIGVITSINEEKFMLRLFPAYHHYMKRTGRFFPRLRI